MPTDFFNRISTERIETEEAREETDVEQLEEEEISSDEEEYFTAEEIDSDDCDFRFTRDNPVNVLSDTVMSERYTQAEIEEVLGVPERWQNRQSVTKSYIDGPEHN